MFGYVKPVVSELLVKENEFYRATYCGVCRAMKKYEEAFLYWNKALDLDSNYLDAQYSKGFCYEEMGEYKNAYEIWSQLSDTLRKRGFDIEMTHINALLQKCKEKLPC